MQIIIVLPLTQLFSKTIVEKASTTMKKLKLLVARGKIFIRTKKWKNGFQKESNAQLIGSWIERVMLIFGRKMTKKSEGFPFQ